jgi:putative ABC transport system substrate-binding protein
MAASSGGVMNNRRKLVIALGSVTLALALPMATYAQQQAKIWRIGFVSNSAKNTEHYLVTFKQQLRDRGFVEGKNFVIETRDGEGKDERLPDLAVELVQLKIDVLMAHAEPAALAAKKATTAIPVVFVAVADPVGSGLVRSLAHPGENVTGLSDLHGDLVVKRLQFLKELVPKASRVAVLSNPNPSCLRQLKDVQSASKLLGVTILPLEARTRGEIDRAFAEMKREHAAGLLVCGDLGLTLYREHIFDQAVKNRVPAIYTNQGWVNAGGLISYGSNFDDLYRGAATYVIKILKGTKPSDLPVEQPTKFELVINMKAARAIGIKFPQSILVQATKVIE